jgi:hypothetical protein
MVEVLVAITGERNNQINMPIRLQCQPIVLVVTLSTHNAADWGYLNIMIDGRMAGVGSVDRHELFQGPPKVEGHL